MKSCDQAASAANYKNTSMPFNGYCCQESINGGLLLFNPTAHGINLLKVILAM
jgi:hypothetical protein